METLFSFLVYCAMTAIYSLFVSSMVLIEEAVEPQEMGPSLGRQAI